MNLAVFMLFACFWKYVPAQEDPSVGKIIL